MQKSGGEITGLVIGFVPQGSDRGSQGCACWCPAGAGGAEVWGGGGGGGEGAALGSFLSSALHCLSLFHHSVNALEIETFPSPGQGTLIALLS